MIVCVAPTLEESDILEGKQAILWGNGYHRASALFYADSLPSDLKRTLLRYVA